MDVIRKNLHSRRNRGIPLSQYRYKLECVQTLCTRGKRQTMKKDIHPDYHEITLVMTDGSKRTTKSTWGKPGDEMRLSIDPLNHPAWTGQQRVLGAEGQVARFNKRFGNLGG